MIPLVRLPSCYSYKQFRVGFVVTGPLVPQTPVMLQNDHHPVSLYKQCRAGFVVTGPLVRRLWPCYKWSPPCLWVARVGFVITGTLVMQTPTTPPCFYKQRRAGVFITGPLVPQHRPRYNTVTTLFLKAAQSWVCYNRPTRTQTLVTLQNDHHRIHKFYCLWIT